MFWAYLVALHIVCALRLGWVVEVDLVSNLSRGLLFVWVLVWIVG